MKHAGRLENVTLVIWGKILRRTATRIAQKKIGERVNETIQLTSVHLTATVLNFHGLSPGLAYP